MDYIAAMGYLSELTKFGFNFGLERIEELLKRLDNPHRRLKIVHIGGTNGKGSTTVMLANILQSAGYRVGTFTSPHLHSYTERFRINGEQIDRQRVASIIEDLRPLLEEMVVGGFEHPTEFEVSTAIAFQYFDQEKVDFLVLEVGLGGAVDSTNVMIPLISVITNVAVDHTNYLGKTIGEIARVKSGIIKPGIPVVTAAAGEALEIITEVCLAGGAPLTVVGRDITWGQMSSSPSGQQFWVRGRRNIYEDLWLSLIGRHQQVNAATAIAAVELLVGYGIPVGAGAVRGGLAATRWPARLESFSGEPLVLIDGAHNYESARSLRQALAEYFPGRSLVLLIGMLEDKEWGKVAAELAPVARAVVVTKPDSPRAGYWQGIASEMRCYVPEVYLLEDIKEALDQALSLARSGELVCVTGSLYMVAGVRELIIKTRGINNVF
ncbi:MAG: bifunctional folylpolyglutamate synthase/dihydrofolate synthase [Desulfotomaculaceae bacterium]|nr:bifunctional folylpolyglutamate synthase/dihydrofolate synthase [Desulfotomaculaceae bacterium]